MGCVSNRPLPNSRFHFDPTKQTAPTKPTENSIIKQKHEKSVENQGSNSCRQNDSSAGEKPKDEIEQNKMQYPQKIQKRRSLITSSHQQQSELQVLQSSSEHESENIDEMITDSGLEGMIREENNFSQIMIYNSKIYMEFNLPKYKAGPLVVPMINYSSYRL